MLSIWDFFSTFNLTKQLWGTFGNITYLEMLRICKVLHEYQKKRDTLNYTEKFRGMYTVGWNYRRKRPNSVGKRPTVGIIFRPSPNFFTTLSVFIRF